MLSRLIDLKLEQYALYTNHKIHTLTPCWIIVCKISCTCYVLRRLFKLLCKYPKQVCYTPECNENSDYHIGEQTRGPRPRNYACFDCAA